MGAKGAGAKKRSHQHAGADAGRDPRLPQLHEHPQAAERKTKPHVVSPNAVKNRGAAQSNCELAAYYHQRTAQPVKGYVPRLWCGRNTDDHQQHQRGIFQRQSLRRQLPGAGVERRIESAAGAPVAVRRQNISR